MRRAVRAIVILDNKLLVMHRNKFGVEYDTLPGGGVDVGEALEQALVRELQEETQVVVSEPRLVFIEHAGDPYGDQYIYLCNYVSGEPELSADSDEAAIDKLGKNLYQPAWLEVSELVERSFVSPKLKQHLLHAFVNGWPETVLEF